MPSISDFIDAGAGTNPIGAAASLLTGGNPLESAGTIFNDIVGGIFGGHTGASGVHFKNDRNTGTSSWWFGKFANMKWRDCDAILKAYNGGGGLKSFGWDGGTPRSAQGIFKRAEDRFFEIFPTYLKDVADGRIELAPSLQEADDLDVQEYLSLLGYGQNSDSNSPSGATSYNEIIETPKTNTITYVLYAIGGFVILKMLKIIK